MSNGALRGEQFGLRGHFLSSVGLGDGKVLARIEESEHHHHYCLGMGGWKEGGLKLDKTPKMLTRTDM